jgi:SP family sugar:H+ symporter-like MFS transporter
MIIFFQMNIVLGSFFISIVNNFTQTINGKASYKIPIAVLLSLPILMIPGLPFLPESPRWLLKKGRDAEARRSLEKLYKDDPKFSVDNEMAFLKTSIREQAERNESAGWLDCFKGTNRYDGLFRDVNYFK